VIYDQLAEMDVQAEFERSMKAMAENNSRFAYCWAVIELQGSLTFSERGQWLCRYADLSIEIALRCAWFEIARNNVAIDYLLREHPSGMPGLFIFGMGKLGGGDLNFSSDVDLVAYFDPDKLPVPDVLGKSYICHKVAKMGAQNLFGGLIGAYGQTHPLPRWRCR
jgi:glutamate-ammonia-ligase adenylyltransferase